MLQAIIDFYPDKTFTKAEGFDDAVIGVDVKYRLVYSIEKCIEILMERDHMGLEAALDYFEINVINKYKVDLIWVYTRFDQLEK
jgi:hypothetical protein